MSVRPTEVVLTARVARRYYLDDRSKTEIADELGISRFRVARLLEVARRDGVVKIEIQSSDRLDTELSEKLQRAYGLKYAIVLDASDDDTAALRTALGAIAADLLREVITLGDVLGVAWARSLEGIAGNVRKMAPCPVVQLTGALLGPGDSDIIDLVRRVARAGGGTPHVFYAPLVAPDAASARTVRRQPDVVRALEMASRVNVAVVGIGAWQPGLSTIFDSVEPEVRERARALGTVGEISGAFIDADGYAVTSPLSRRIIGVTADYLQNVGVVLSIAYGAGKAPAVDAALQHGLVNGLVTHSTLARALLDRSSAAAAADIGDAVTP